MATKSSKIAVTLQPSLKQKLREYGKDNQIKNFSGVILSILDEYFGSSGSSSSPAPASDVMTLIQELTARVEKLESGEVATTSSAKVEKPKKAVAKPKVATRKASTRSTATKSTTAKPAKAKTTTAKTTTRKPAKPKPAKPVKKTAAKNTKTSRTVKSSSKAAPVKKGKGAATQWMSTREAFNTYGGSLSWSRFSKLTPEELKERFNLDSDLSRKVRGSRFNQWLKAGK